MSRLLSVNCVANDADCVPAVVVAIARTVHWPFLTVFGFADPPTPPVAGLNAAVLKLNVTGAAASSAAVGARFATACVWMMESVPHLRMPVMLRSDVPAGMSTL